MADILSTAHTQAAVIGRQHGGDTRRQMQADKQAARKVVYSKDGEGAYIANFVKDILSGRYTDEEGNPEVARIASRSLLYSRRLVGTANQAFVDASPASVLFFWRLGGAEQHCLACPALAANSPYSKETLPTTPGSADTPCVFRCLCSLNRSDGLVGFDLNDQV
jgi:hypothetical protein